MVESVLSELILASESKIVLLVLDGLGDLPHPHHDFQTPLEAARTPNFDRLAMTAALGRILPVAPGITPGSGPGHLALFGYDPITTKVGRGVLEALGAGMDLRAGDVAARANFCTVDEHGTVVDRRAGRISSEVCARLVEKLAHAQAVGRVEDVEVILRAGKGHRFVALLRGPGLSGDVTDADPHREGSQIPAVRAHQTGAEKTARIVNALIARFREVLHAEHPANAALMRGLSLRPVLAGHRERFGLRSAAIAAYPMYRGVAELVGMEVLPTGERLSDAIATAAARFSDFDFFFLHVKGTDMAGEDGDFPAKVAVIEEVDAALPSLLALHPDVLCVTGDHSTPVLLKGHSWHPVPVLVHGRWAGADRVARFHEGTARQGSLGTLASRDLMAVLLANAGRLDKYGA